MCDQIVKKPPREVQLGQFIHGYLVAALWSSTDDTGAPLDDAYSVDEIHPDTVAKMKEACEDFFDANADDLTEYTVRRDAEARSRGYTAWDCAGHDFWLTRNGHGVGFWDRGLGELGDRLSEAAKAYRGIDLYVGDDGKVYEG